MKLAIANHGKPRVENHAKGGIMRHFQMHVYRKTDFKLLVYQCFRWASTTRGRHSHEAHQAPQTQFHQARVGKTANSLLKKGAKIHLKNERKIIRPKRSKSRPKIEEEDSAKNRPKNDENPAFNQCRRDHVRHIDRKPNPGLRPTRDLDRPLYYTVIHKNIINWYYRSTHY